MRAVAGSRYIYYGSKRKTRGKTCKKVRGSTPHVCILKNCIGRAGWQIFLAGSHHDNGFLTPNFRSEIQRECQQMIFLDAKLKRKSGRDTFEREGDLSPLPTPSDMMYQEI